MLNLAELSNDSIAKLARAVAAVEGLADRQSRSASQRCKSVRKRVKKMMRDYGLDDHWARLGRSLRQAQPPVPRRRGRPR